MSIITILSNSKSEFCTEMWGNLLNWLKLLLPFPFPAFEFTFPFPLPFPFPSHRAAPTISARSSVVISVWGIYKSNFTISATKRCILCLWVLFIKVSLTKPWKMRSLFLNSVKILKFQNYCRELWQNWFLQRFNVMPTICVRIKNLMMKITQLINLPLQSENQLSWWYYTHCGFICTASL